MRMFWLGVLVGIVIGAMGATIYSEVSSAPEDAAAEQTPDNQP